MINLIKNEFYKLLHKKSTYIILFIMLAYLILINVIYNIDITSIVTDSENYEEIISNDQTYLNNLDKKSTTYWSEFVSYQSEIDTYTLVKEYSGSTWKINLLLNDYINVSQKYYEALYINSDKETSNIYLDQLNDIKNYLSTDNWQEYVTSLKDKAMDKIIQDNNQLSNLSNKEAVTNLKNDLEYENYLITLYDYRLNNNVGFDNSYLDKSLTNLENNKLSLISLNNKEELTEDEKTSYDSLNSSVLEDEYIINNKVDVNNTHSLKNVLQYFFDEFYFLIIVFVIMVGGSIISDEFNKGTIKSLLTVPYSRTQILLSKFITVILSVPLIAIFLVILELLIGGITFGFDSILLPILAYNYTNGTLLVYNVFNYMFINFNIYFPFFIMISTIAFFLSCLLSNTAFAIAVSYCLIVAGSIINNLAVIYNIEFLKYFITLNWNFTQYMFGKTPQYKFIDLKFSILMWLIYFIVFLLISIIVFKKKNIKNI